MEIKNTDSTKSDGIITSMFKAVCKNRLKKNEMTNVDTVTSKSCNRLLFT